MKLRIALPVVALFAITACTDDDSAPAATTADERASEAAAAAEQIEATTTPDPTPSPEPESEPAPPEPPEPEREGRVEGNCDVNLDSDLSSDQEGRYKALASVDAINTGTIDITVDVWVEYPQLGAEPLRYTETVRVAAGDTETVYIDQNITRNEWNRYLDAPGACAIGGDITFGDDDFAALMIERMDATECAYASSVGIDEYIAEIREALTDLWQDSYDDLLANVIEQECG